MHLRLAVVFSCCLLPAMSAFAEQPFPYTAYITSDDVYVRSGPGQSYYPTDKLKEGDKVEIYRHDPGGWYAIRPVEGSFSWISGRYLEVGEGGLGTIVGDRVAARVGSAFSEVRDVIQVRLHEGESVEVIGQKEFGGQPGSGTWYKIAPPSGEFRWVFGRFVDPDYHHSGVRKAPAGNSPLVETAEPSAELAPVAGRVAKRWSTSSTASQQGPAASDRVEAESPAPQTSAFPETAADPSQSDAPRRLSPEEFRAELNEIDMELSIMLAEEPTVWKSDDLVVRAQALLTEAETAVERGRVRLLANKIAQSDDVKRRYDAVNGTRAATERHNRQLAELGQAQEAASSPPATAARFDGVGRLARVVPPKLGFPRYALVDEKGDVRCFVTAAPGVNMNYYLGHTIGVSGARGYITDKRAQHVTAKYVTPL
ncbi:MAG: SH3 domain-containing protein, partial [Planctomycetota bacterium]